MSESKKEIVVKESVQEVVINENTIKNLIYVIRGRQVMLDSDLAKLYRVETKALNRAVKRNIMRFPDDFCFQLSEVEFENLRCQIGTSSLENDNYGGRRYLPYVFTEQGISMLSAVLRSEIAVKVSVKIMRTFVELRHFMANNSLVLNRMNEIEAKQLLYQKDTDEKFDKVFQYISEHEEVKQKIFFEGQIYDAFSLLVELISKADKELVLIDNYVDVSTLNVLAKKKAGVKVVVYTVKKTKLSKADVDNYNQQYPTLEVKYTDAFHDRFLLVDNAYAFHIGASIKDAGKKCFGINKMEDTKLVTEILERLKSVESGE